MIKNLLNADEDPPEGTKVIVEETVIPPPLENPISELPEAESTKAHETRQVFEIPENARFFKRESTGEELEMNEAELESALVELGIDMNAEPSIEGADSSPTGGQETQRPENEPPLSSPNETKKSLAAAPPLFGQTDYQAESPAETIRNSGLAYSAAIVLFGAVVLMMIFGWLVDLLLGTSPWGVVVGIILGGTVGFIQFFRITSGIFKK